MPRLIFTEKELNGIMRCREFLAEKSFITSNKASKTI